MVVSRCEAQRFALALLWHYFGTTELLHQQTVRQHQQVLMPCLALAVSQRTVTHTQILFTIAVKRLCTGPTISIDVQHSMNVPMYIVRHQHLGGTTVAAVSPQDQDSHGVHHLRQANGLGEVPLPLATVAVFFPILRTNRSRQFICSDRATAGFEFAIGLQITDIPSRVALRIGLAVDVVEVLSTRLCL